MKKLIYAVLVMALVAFLVPMAFGAPLMRISESEFDFGYAPQNSSISHVFWLYNDGDDSLKIEKVVPG